MSNPADICRECEVAQRARKLEEEKDYLKHKCYELKKQVYALEKCGIELGQIIQKLRDKIDGYAYPSVKFTSNKTDYKTEEE